MKTFSAAQVNALLPYSQLIPALGQAFRENYTVPARQHFDYPNPEAAQPSTLLLMPAWKTGQYLGVKLITVSPENYRRQLPSIQGGYLLFDAVTGVPLAQIEAQTLTARRTAAASALAATFLAHPESSSLLVLGAGALAPELIEAHLHIRPIRQVWIWGRTPQKAVAVAQSLRNLPAAIEPVTDYQQVLPLADVITTATLSKEPLIPGKLLRPGQHLDLVGAYRPDMRESDDDCIRRARVFADTFAGASKEGGDLAIPLASGLLRPEDIEADLFDLCRGTYIPDRQHSDITLFKSVGHALEDLCAARLIWENH